MRVHQTNTPKGRHDPEILVYAEHTGYTVVVGYHIVRNWYECARETALSERGVRRATKRLLKWWHKYVKRHEISARLEREFNDTT